MKVEKDNLSSVAGPEVLRGTPPSAVSDIRQKFREDVIASLTAKPFIAPRVLLAGVKMAEGLLVALVAVANLLRYPGHDGLNEPWLYATVIAVAGLFVPVFLQLTGAYRLNTILNPSKSLTSLFASWLMMFAGIALIAYVGKVGADLSRQWLISWSISGLFFAIAFRFVLAAVIRRLNSFGQLNRRAVLVGGGVPADHVIATLAASHDVGVTVLGVFDDRGEQRAPVTAGNLHMLGSVDDLIDFVRSTRVDTLILTLPVTAENRLLQILERLWVLPVDIRLSAQDQRLRFRPRAYSYIGNLALLDLFDRPLGDWGPYLKTIEDKAIASLALVLLSPLFALVALAVKLESKGPVFFRQKRYGFNNEMIEVYKFRSMYTDQTDKQARKLVTKNDPRVTRVGRFIRKTSLDELPQLINVLRGELSLVGPRPHATMASAAGNLYETVVEGYFARHKVKPGMTGWAQINGWRGETDTAEKIERRVEHDLYYIENWSLTFDLYILARTPLALLQTERAY
jgi:Undecaprenyl-phosphate glucose phosphotransferase